MESTGTRGLLPPQPARPAPCPGALATSQLLSSRGEAPKGKPSSVWMAIPDGLSRVGLFAPVAIFKFVRTFASI